MTTSTAIASAPKSFLLTTVAGSIPPPPSTIQRGWDPDFDEGSDFDIIVDKDSGNDSNDGLTLGTAKETVSAGLAAVSPGGTVKVRNTNTSTKYREQIIGTGKGGPDAANKTRIVGFETEKPEITAAELLTGAVPCVVGDAPIVGDLWANIYKVTGFTTADIAAGNPRSLFLFENGRRLSPCMTRLALPQFPLSETNSYDWPDADEVITTGGINLPGLILGVRDPEVTDQFTQTQIENSDVVFIRDPNGTTRSTIASFDPVTKIITYTDQTRTYEDNDNQNRFVLVNCLPAMRRGQWGFVDNGLTTDIYFWPYSPAQVNVSIEYSARGNVIDVSDENNFEFRSIQMTRAASGNTGTSADGLYAFTADKSGSTRGSGITIANCRFAELYRSITGYGAFWINGMDNCLVEKNLIEDCWGMFAFFFQGGLVTSTMGMAVNNIFRNNRVRRIDKSPARFYGQQFYYCIDNQFEDSGNEAHANKWASYESTEYGLWAYNLFFGCSGRGVWQETSNIYFYMNWMPATYTDIDGRALTDQNNATASPGELNATNCDCYFLGNMCPAYRNGAFYTNGGIFGTALWALTNYGVMNNVFNGYIFESGRDITDGVKTNMLTAGTIFDASDTVVALDDVFINYVNGDVQEKVTSPARTAATTSVVTLPGTDGPITLESKFPTVNFDRDAAGIAINRATPPMGPFSNHDDVPNHGPFYINEPTLNAMPVVGNSVSANNDHYVQGKPFPTGFDVQYVRSLDQYAIGEDWEEIVGATSDPYLYDPGDEGYFVARRSAPAGTTIYRYSKVNARVIATHPITAPTLLYEYPDGNTTAALAWTETGTFTPTGTTLILFTSLNDNIVQSTITATVGAQGRPNGTGTPIVMDPFLMRNTRNQTVFALMPDPLAGPVTIQYQSSDGHFSFLVQVLNAAGTGALQFGTVSTTPTETIEKELKTAVENTSLLYVLNRYSGDFATDPITWTGATKIAEQNTGGTSTSGDLTSSVAYEQGMPKEVYDARATWTDTRNIAAVAVGLVPVTIPTVTDIMAGIGDFENPALWDWDVGQAEVTGGAAVYNTSVNFRGVFARGSLAIPCPPSVTLTLLFTVSNIVLNARLWINVQFRDSGGVDIGSSVKIFDTDDDGPLVAGLNMKIDCVTSPVGTADMEIEGIDVVVQPGEFDIDDIQLIYTS